MTALRASIVTVLVIGCSPVAYQHGVPNLAQVDANIWRSGQITTAEGWDYIAQLAAGRTIDIVKLNYDAEGSDRIAIDRGWNVHYLPIQPEGDQDWWDDALAMFKRPDPVSIDNAVIVLIACQVEPAKRFCLVHCTHGQDRTGLVIGKYRVLEEGWSKRAAYAEMLAHHFHPELYGLHETWEEFSPP